MKDALALPLEARAALIGPLVDSLDTEVDEDAEEAWREQIRQRLHEIDNGTAKLVLRMRRVAYLAARTISFPFAN